MMQKVLYSGWLTKSPPEKKAQGPWKLFKSQWRRRFFVLANMNASNVLPGMCPAQLEYFDNEKLTKRKGSIDLNNCEQVLDHVESECYRHIFVLKTIHRGQERAYYLAADSEEEMGRWVNHLRSLLSLQDEGPVRFVPHSLRHSQSAHIPPRTMTADHRRLMSTPASAETSGLLSTVSETIDPFDSTPKSGKSPEDYFPLVECISGEAPTPPPRVLSPQFSSHSQPRQSTRQDSTLDQYTNVPNEDTSDRDSAYDYPPPRQTISDRDSTYDYNFPPGSGSRDESERDSAYDYPPNFLQRSCDSDPERPLWECESRQVEEVIGDTYDVLPPKSHYVHRNLSNASHHSVGRDPCSADDDTYDMPPLLSRTTNPLPPPKAHPVAPKLHRYINAAPTPVASNRTTLTSVPRVSTDDGVYLAMNNAESTNNMYMPMAEMDHSQPRRMRSVIHQSPAHQKSDKPPKAPATLPRTFGKEGGILVAMNPTIDPLYSCYATKKTFSFKRRLPSPESRAVVLPQKAGPLHGPSSSEDEDEDSSETNSVQETLNSMNSASLERESRASQENPVVQYLDLDLDASTAQVSIGSSCSDSQNKIEYNEIDVERTKALFDAKLMLEKERKGSNLSDS